MKPLNENTLNYHLQRLFKKEGLITRIRATIHIYIIY